MPEEVKAEAKPAEAEELKPAGMSPVIKIILIVIIISGLSVGAYFISKSLLLPKYEAYQAAKTQVVAEEAKHKVPQMGLIKMIDNITVNTLGSGGRRYVIADVALEASSQEIIDEITAREPQIRDELIRYLRRQTAQHVLDLDFQERSRHDLTKMLNAHLSSGKIDSMYYVKLLLQ